jgi:hypothetical protein
VNGTYEGLINDMRQPFGSLWRVTKDPTMPPKIVMPSKAVSNVRSDIDHKPRVGWGESSGKRSFDIPAMVWTVVRDGRGSVLVLLRISELEKPLGLFVCSQFKRFDRVFRVEEGRRLDTDLGDAASLVRTSDSREDSASSSVDSDERLFMGTNSPKVAQASRRHSRDRWQLFPEGGMIDESATGRRRRGLLS